MESRELRNQYLRFFESKEHKVISSSSLMPENDPSVLFTTSGMHPLVPYLSGENHPEGKRLVNVQKCVRTQDIEEVGDDCHHTFFEMLGNWSLGDYFKKESIKWSLEFLTSPEWLALDKNRLSVSVFEGDEDAPFDQESYDTWSKLGISQDRIAKLPKKNNWWGMQTGPCGPDTEIFYWTGDPNNVPEHFDSDNPQWVEIWNNVFMQLSRKKDGTLEPLTQKNVDTGMGLERILTALNGLNDDYKTDLFTPIIEAIEKFSSKKYDDSDQIKKSMRIIADHIRAATMMMSDDRGLSPCKVEHGYVIRRLIRRAVRHGRIIGIEGKFCAEVAQKVMDVLGDVYQETIRNKDFVLEEFEKEEKLFRKALENGIKQFDKMFGSTEDAIIHGEQAFRLYETFGFPVEMIQELAKERGLTLDFEGFERALKDHQKDSRASTKQKFHGGLADNSETVMKLHTATHLLHTALRKILGDHVRQKGSNITSERLRFDFTHHEKITEDQIRQVQALVNEQIQKALPIICEEMTAKEAKESGAIGLFGEKYGERVKVYTVGQGQECFSKEICGGPHAVNTKDLGTFKILKEESSSAGVRRIKAVVE